MLNWLLWCKSWYHRTHPWSASAKAFGLREIIKRWYHYDDEENERWVQR